MDTDGNRNGLQQRQCLLEIREGMAKIAALCRAVEDGLHTQFHRYISLFFQFCQQTANLRADAVRPCGDGKPDGIRQPYRLGVQLPQAFHWGIGAGKGLEIGNISYRSPFGQHTAAIGFKLLGNRTGRGDKITASGRGAVDTAAGALAAITIGAGKTAIQGHLGNPSAIFVFQIPEIGIKPFSGAFKGQSHEISFYTEKSRCCLTTEAPADFFTWYRTGGHLHRPYPGRYSPFH